VERASEESMKVMRWLEEMRTVSERLPGGGGKSASFLATPQPGLLQHGDKRWAAALGMEPEASSHRSQ
jgi:hypothetical protein